MALRRRTAVAVTATLLALAAATTSCSTLDTALDCVQTANAIATSVDNLQQAVSNASDNPLQADQALNDIEGELDNLSDKTDNADLGRAVDDLSDAVDNVRTSIKDGGNTPDLTPVTDAATEISKVCSP